MEVLLISSAAAPPPPTALEAVLRTMGAPASVDNVLSLSEEYCVSLTVPIAGGAGDFWKVTLWLDLVPDSSSSAMEVRYAFPAWFPATVLDVRAVACSMASTMIGAPIEAQAAAMITQGTEMVIKVAPPFQDQSLVMFELAFTAPPPP